MGSRYDLAEAAAAVEIGRRHPYLTLFAKRQHVDSESQSSSQSRM